MSLVYRIMYRFGFTPWDSGQVPSELVALVEGDGAPAPGRALDLGCGTGTQAVYLAEHGWRVTGVDALAQPLRRARDRAAAANVTVSWRQADASRLVEAGLEQGAFTLLFDRGCYHGLSESERDGYATGTGALAAPGAVLLLMAFARNRVPAAPAGTDRDEIAARFGAAWELVADAPDTGPAPGGPLHGVPRTWYRLRRR